MSGQRLSLVSSARPTIRPEKWLAWGCAGIGGSRSTRSGGGGGSLALGRCAGAEVSVSRRRSSRSSRSTMASGSVSLSGRAARMRATSRVTRGSGASRMATIALPMRSIARTQRAGPRPARTSGGSTPCAVPPGWRGSDEGEEIDSELLDDVEGELCRIPSLANRSRRDRRVRSFHLSRRLSPRRPRRSPRSHRWRSLPAAI